jgi:CRISPR-associated exonuclease Cas4
VDALSWLLLILCVLLLAMAAGVRLKARAAGREGGLPRGRLLYSDTGFPVGRVERVTIGEGGVRQERPLLSRRHGLVGRPDYLVRTAEGVVPVEAKSTRRPPGGRPYDSHLMQLAAYCLLAEEALGETVPYGLVRYSDGEVRVAYTPERKEELLALLSEMREARAAEEVHRSHDEPRRCANCSMRDACDETLT